MTLNEAIERYIESKSNILSPATIRGYENIRKNRLKSIITLKLNKINKQIAQMAINAEAENSSPKTVRNVYGLLSAVMGEYNPDTNISVSLPAKTPFVGQSLNGEQISKLIESIIGDEAEIAILLALWLGLRRSEIIGLKWKNVDLVNKTLTIREVLVPNKEHKLVQKGTAKTQSSNRTLGIPDYICDKMKAANKNSDYVVTLAGDTIRKRLQRYCNQIGIPKVRLHDLRHTMASVGLLLNVGDKYMMERGGWSSFQTMKNVYQHTINAGKQAAENVIDEFFNNLCNTKNNTHE